MLGSNPFAAQYSGVNAKRQIMIVIIIGAVIGGLSGAIEVLGLKHFLLDFSLIRERELQETLIWQDYMVYALLMGIADKVAPQLRRLYPDLQPEIDQYARQATWAGYYTHVMYNAYERERQRREEARSGGSGGSASFGGGGGFSGGGGGGTR